MKFSIITTFYNNTIKEVETIKNSILNQTYTKWEWIISDDFSKDSIDHIQVLKNLPNEDKRIKYVEQKSKKEIFWNPQTYATGDIVMLIGADDWISNRTLEIFNYHFIKYPELILITSESNILNENLNLISSTFINYNKHVNAFDRINSSTFHNWLNMGVPLTWRNIPIDFTEGIELDNKSIINDYLIHTRLEELGKFIHLPRIFYYCKIRSNSVSRKIDTDNDFSYSQSSKINEIITQRRGCKKLNSFLNLYNEVLEESELFYYSSLVNELKCHKASFITPGFDLTPSKKDKLKELYIDHDLSFNSFDNDIDYYFINLSDSVDIDIFLESFNKIKTAKEINILCKNSFLSNQIKENIGNFWWYTLGEKNWIKTCKN